MAKGSILKVLDVGGNGGDRARKEFYPGADVLPLDIKSGWDVMKLGLPDGEWDVILANHFIEHIPDPDFFLQQCKNIMKPNTVLNIGTPNLCAWFNRILFLFGYVPHSVELSKKFNVGKAFNWNKEELGGHIYVYSVPALKQLLESHGFKIKSISGECSTYHAGSLVSLVDKFLTKINCNLASAFRIKCTL